MANRKNRRGTDFITKMDPIGKLEYYNSGLLQSRWRRSAAENSVDKELTVSDFKWMNRIVNHNGACLPPDRTMIKLLTKGLLKFELTDEAAELLENEGKGTIIMDVLAKSAL